MSGTQRGRKKGLEAAWSLVQLERCCVGAGMDGQRTSVVLHVLHTFPE